MSSQLDPTLIKNALISKQLSTGKKEGANLNNKKGPDRY